MGKIVPGSFLLRNESMQMKYTTQLQRQDLGTLGLSMFACIPFTNSVINCSAYIHNSRLARFRSIEMIKTAF